MKSFFQKSILLWTITRIAVLLIFLVAAFMTDYRADSRMPLVFAADLRNILFIIIHGILATYELSGRRMPFLTRSFGAGLSIMCALGCIFLALAINFAFILPAIWLFVFGLFDAMDIQPYIEE
jgi:hypothetical protein